VNGRRVLAWFCLGALILVLPTGWISAWSWEWDVRWIYVLLVAFFVSSLLTPLSIRLAPRLGAMDVPNARKVHKTAVPRLGGLAVYGGTILALARNYMWSTQLSGLLAGGTLIYLMGVVEDSRGLSASTRMLGQLIASALVIASGLHVTFVHGLPGGRVLAYLITAVWLVGLTNAVNFMDGIDGLAAGMGTVCSLLYVSIGWPSRQEHLVYASAALSGACLGFIPYNWNPASTFLGDAGSTFIGFTLAGLALMGSWTPQHPVLGLISPILILAIPIFDMIYTTVSRIKNGSVRTLRQWIEYTGKDHFHHRLMRLGMTVPEAVGFILMVNLALGLGALVIYFSGNALVPFLLLVQTSIVFTIIVVLMLLGRQFSRR